MRLFYFLLPMSLVIGPRSPVPCICHAGARSEVLIFVASGCLFLSFLSFSVPAPVSLVHVSKLSPCMTAIPCLVSRSTRPCHLTDRGDARQKAHSLLLGPRTLPCPPTARPRTPVPCPFSLGVRACVCLAFECPPLFVLVCHTAHYMSALYTPEHACDATHAPRNRAPPLSSDRGPDKTERKKVQSISKLRAQKGTCLYTFPTQIAIRPSIQPTNQPIHRLGAIRPAIQTHTHRPERAKACHSTPSTRIHHRRHDMRAGRASQSVQAQLASGQAN